MRKASGLNKSTQVRTRLLSCAAFALIALQALTYGQPSEAASPQPSYLFGRDPQEAFGRAADEPSYRFRSRFIKFQTHGYRELLRNWGSETPSEIVLLVKDDEINSSYTTEFLAYVALEKGNLMRLYNLSNRDYNRLAAMSFGILGRESKFASSRRYFVKEMLPSFVVRGLKEDAAVFRALGETARAVWTMTSPKYNFSISDASSGPTQIKKVPKRVEANYCVDESELHEARNAAVATMGFLAEALKQTRQAVKNRSLSQIDENNIFDYVLYVYTGRIRQGLKDPTRVAFNPYIRAVKGYMKALTLLERNSDLKLRPVPAECSDSILPVSK